MFAGSWQWKHQLSAFIFGIRRPFYITISWNGVRAWYFFCRPVLLKCLKVCFYLTFCKSIRKKLNLVLKKIPQSSYSIGVSAEFNQFVFLTKRRINLSSFLDRSSNQTNTGFRRYLSLNKTCAYWVTYMCYWSKRIDKKFVIQTTASFCKIICHVMK